MDRESMTFDVIIVGAGPAGLSTACHLMQQAQKKNKILSVCVLEKSAEPGAHIVSGAVFEPTALDELFPDWKNMNAPITTPVTQENFYYLHDHKSATKIPRFFQPETLNNHGNYVISLANLCRWLALQAENMGVEIFCGFSAHSLIIENKQVKGVITGDAGLDEQGQPGANFTSGIALQAQQTILAEGARGHLGKQLIQTFKLDQHSDPQHYSLGVKEVWQIPEVQCNQGKIMHTLGWPLSETGSTGGGFLYHLDKQQVSVGFITDLNYKNPYLNPFDEFQRFKHHPVVAKVLTHGERIAYGARAIAKGGIQSLPDLVVPGALLVGCNAGTLNFSKIKGIHTAMKSGMLAAESVAASLNEPSGSRTTSNAVTLKQYQKEFYDSWIYKELYSQRNAICYIKRLGSIVGGALTWLDISCFAGKLPWTLHNRTADHQSLHHAKHFNPINYPKPDGKISFDKLSSVFLANINHREQQPCHLILSDPNLPLKQTLPRYNEPAQRYCPAGVYEIVEGEVGGKQFIINAQNCIHCKTCDIKDPAQNITWVTPEGGSGPNYPNT